MIQKRLLPALLAAALLLTGGCALPKTRTWVDLDEVSSRIEKPAANQPVLEAATMDTDQGSALPRSKDLIPGANSTNDYLNQLAPPQPVTLVAGQEIGLNFDNADIYEFIQVVGGMLGRSEERRVGKECRSRWSPYH